MSLPAGTVTFLFTDIEGSTRLVQDLGDAVSKRIFADHRRLLIEAVESSGGSVYQDQGESFVFAFRRAKAAVRAAVAAQRAFRHHPWPNGGKCRVRMGLHTGEPVGEAGEYVGLDVHRAARICGAGHGGQILLSLTTQELVADDVPDGITFKDLGEHRLKDLTRPHRLFQIVTADLPADFPPLTSLDLFPNNLPRQLTSFIGREEQIAEVERLVSTTPLLTLTGVGGVGKTRLALHVAADVLDRFKDGVWLVELAPLSDPSLVPQSVSTVLGVREQPERSILETISDFLQPKELLLVLDNAEHLIAACAQLADALLRACPNLRIMATSRENLGIAGETVWPVPALSFPDTEQLPPVEKLAESEAIRLFVERATGVVPTFKLTDRNGLAVASICQRLDGLPLAIELAAARVKVLSVEQIAERLNDRFGLLTGGGRTTLPRHQTLQAAIDWSYDLLSEKERTLLRRLSVFAGGWTLEAVQAICVGDGIEGSDILDLLTRLVDKSLVVAEEQGQEVRYHLLETVRQYAREKLVKAGENAKVQGKHRDWYLALAERMEPKRGGPEQASGLERLEAEHDNLRGALAWSLAQGETEAAVRLAGALGWFWHIRGYWSEGREHLKVVLSHSDDCPLSVRAKALYEAAGFALAQRDHRAARPLYEESLSIFRQLGSKRDVAQLVVELGMTARREEDYETARSFYEESLAMFRELDDKLGIGRALLYLGGLAHNRGDYVTARSFYGESLANFREAGSRRAIAHALEALGGLAVECGDYGAARAMHEEALAIFRAMGDKDGTGWALNGLGTVALSQGDYAAAHRLFEESLAIFRELGNIDGVAWALYRLGRVARRQGDYAAARPLHEEAVAFFRAHGNKVGIGRALMSLGDMERLQNAYDRARALCAEAMLLLRDADKPSVADCLEKFASLARSKSRPERAARLFGATEALRDAIGYRLPPADRLEYDRDVLAVRTGLGAKAFTEAWSEGRTMTLEQAIEYALSNDAADP